MCSYCTMILGFDLPTSVHEEENKPLASHLHQSARMKQNINIAWTLNEYPNKTASAVPLEHDSLNNNNTCLMFVLLSRSLHSSNFPRMFALWVFPANLISFGTNIRFGCQSDKEKRVGSSPTYVILGTTINEAFTQPHPVAIQCCRRG